MHTMSLKEEMRLATMGFTGYVRNMQGAIVRLTEQGQLCCSYLGTDPCLSVAVAPESREYSLREAEQELNRLENAIKSSSESVPGRKTTETDLKVKVFAGPMSEIPYVHLEASAPLRNVRIMVDVARPLVALNSDVTLTTLLDHHQMAFTVKQAETMLPSSLDLRVVAFYQNSSEKYRIQSDNFAVLWIPVLELLRRLHQYYKRSSNDDALKCSYSSSLPLQEYFSVIDDYVKVRQEALEVEELLSQRAAQFRVVQKCVLTKLKDKTPTPLNNLDSLLEVTQRELLGLGKRAVEATNEYQRMLSKLSSASQLLVLLLKLKTQMSTEDHKLLQDTFHVDLDASITEGWEEKLEAAICYQLQTGQPDDELPPVPKELTPLKDGTRLKQLIAIIFEKVLDGLRLSQNDLPSRKVDNQNKESDHKEPKPEVFSLDNASTMSSPIPGPSTSKPVGDENDLQGWMADAQETESSNNSLQQNSP
ncbi:hypothetical protein MTO96_020583 [Rhipicephalus appendiculatus]